MQSLTEAIVVALITAAVALGGAWWKFRGEVRKSAQDEMATNTTARLELERLLMARIDQMQTHIGALEGRIAAKDSRIMELEKRVDELETERDQWKNEAAQLRAELKRICADRGGDGVLRGVTG